MSGPSAWSEWIGLADLRSGPVTRLIAADRDARRALADDLGVDRLDRLEAEVSVAPWLDGAVIDARWSAVIEQTCGVTLEPFGTELAGAFSVRALPSSSPHAPKEPTREVAVDPEAEDPPDLLDEDRVDLAGYVVEHLALEIDPFPRRPGAVFEPPAEPPAEEQPPSPFAALRDLQPKPGAKPGQD